MCVTCERVLIEQHCRKNKASSPMFTVYSNAPYYIMYLCMYILCVHKCCVYVCCRVFQPLLLGKMTLTSCAAVAEGSMPEMPDSVTGAEHK